MPQPTQHTTTVVQLCGLPYYVRSRVEAQVKAAGSVATVDAPFLPTTVMHVPTAESLDLKLVEATFLKFSEKDDVFTDGFKQSALLIVSVDGGQVQAEKTYQAVLENQTSSSPGLMDFLQSRQLKIHMAYGLAVPNGPYFLHGKDLHQAWRLFPDHLGAFASTIVPDDTKPGSFLPLSNVAFTGTEAAVAVPSRLYYAAGSDADHRPLLGQRVAVKDNINIAGIITGLGSKSFARLYGEQKKNSAVVQLLVDQGAIVVGKTKLSAWAGSEVPPTQCIDYFPPWNARGDGYQGPSGSSSGAAASSGGYDWLDVSIGTDTNGSTRFPATSHGVWGLKVTWNAISSEGLVESCASYDSFGLFARNTRSMQKLLAGANFPAPSASGPTKLLFPEEWFPLGNEAQQAMTNTFIEAIKAHLGLELTRISLEEEWKRTGPEHIRNETLADLGTAVRSLYGYDEYHNFDSFRNDYKETFGELAFVSPSHTERWNGWKNTPVEDRNVAYEKVMSMRAWWTTTMFSGANNTNTVMIVPHGRPGANYRDRVAKPPPAPAVPEPPKVNPILSTTIGGLPQVLIPIGQNPYQSVISGRTEYAPIFTTLVGAPGTDASLLKIAQETLDQAAWPSEVLTGRYMFTVGDNVRHSSKVSAGKL